LTQTFVESCVDFEVIHGTEIATPGIPTLSNSILRYPNHNTANVTISSTAVQ